jgi:orotate phosphoribosyltransferase
VRSLAGVCDVVGALVIVDRLQGARERLEGLGVRLVSLLTVEELFECTGLKDRVSL